MTLAHTLAAAIATLALAAPIASARPLVDPQPRDTSTPSARLQDASKNGLNDLGPVYWSYDYLAGAPRPTAATVDIDDGPLWVTIGFGIAGACLLVGAGAALAGRTCIRSRSPRVAA